MAKGWWMVDAECWMGHGNDGAAAWNLIASLLCSTIHVLGTATTYQPWMGSDHASDGPSDHNIHGPLCPPSTNHWPNIQYWLSEKTDKCATKQMSPSYIQTYRHTVLYIRITGYYRSIYFEARQSVRSSKSSLSILHIPNTVSTLFFCVSLNRTKVTTHQSPVTGR